MIKLALAFLRRPLRLKMHDTEGSEVTFVAPSARRLLVLWRYYRSIGFH